MKLYHAVCISIFGIFRTLFLFSYLCSLRIVANKRLLLLLLLLLAHDVRHYSLCLVETNCLNGVCPHLYANDTQPDRWIYGACHPQLLRQMAACVDFVATWIQSVISHM